MNRFHAYILGASVLLLSFPRSAAQRANTVITKKPSRVTEYRNPRDLFAPVVASSNRFAVTYFKAAYESSPQENVLTSPASLSYAFALLLNGTTGSGRDQIADIFDLRTIPIVQVNRANAALHAVRKSHPVRKSELNAVVGEDGRSFQPYTMAGAIWIPEGHFSRSFLAVNASSYGYSAFLRRPAAASINQWASRETHGKLSEIVRDIGNDDFVLATLVNFKSRWVQPFSPSETHSSEFTLLSTAKKPVQMMPKRSPDFTYLKGSNFQAVKLNFYDAAMFVALPDENSSLQAFVDALTTESWQDWSGQFIRHDGYLELPRFEIKQERDGMAVLKKMGLTLPFSDFHTFVPLVGIPEGAKLTRVQEGASMKVDETGAELTSYEVVGGVRGGICGNCPPPPPPFHMVVNRPFFFWIVDTRTDQTLFMGTVVEP